MYSGSYTPRTRQYILDNFTPVGLHVLVVDDDPLCLMVLERMLRQCNYEVTTSNRVNHALKLLREEDNDFDIVISDVYMPDEDGFKLLEVIGLELDLPVIMISANGDFSVVMKGVIHGACDYLIKPVRIEELQNIWQHVIRRKSKDLLKSDLQGENDVDAQASLAQEELYRNRKEALEIPDVSVDDMEVCVEDISGNAKKARVNWSVQLHQQFVNAVNQLGIEKAVPKKVLEIMNVQGLSRENVASHLQKYRLYLKRLSGVIPEPLPVASFQASDDGLPGGSMLVRPGRRRSEPAATVKGLNLGAGLLFKKGKSQKVDLGTLKSLSQLKFFQQKQAANRAQVLSAIGVGEPACSASSSRGGLFRMASLDASFLLQAAPQEKEEVLSPGVSSVKVVDDLAMRNISRSVKLEDDVVSPGASPGACVYDMRQRAREGRMQWSAIASHEEQQRRINSAILDQHKLNHCRISSVEDDKLGCVSAAPVHMQGIPEETRKYQGDPMQTDVNRQVANADYGFAYGMHSTPYMQAIQAEPSGSELTNPDHGQDQLQPMENATREVPTSVDDTENSTKQSYEVSMGSMATEMSGESFSECTFEALINDLGIISPAQQHNMQQTNPEVIDVDEYLRLD